MDINRIILEFLYQQKGYLVAYLIFMIAYPVTSVVLPKYYGQMIDELKSNKPPQFRLTLILLIVVNIMYLILEKIDTIFIPKLQAYIRVNIVKVVLENYEEYTDKLWKNNDNMNMIISKRNESIMNFVEENK